MRLKIPSRPLSPLFLFHAFSPVHFSLAIDGEGSAGIRVNSLSPDHVTTPMAKGIFTKTSDIEEIRESENVLRGLANLEQFRGAAYP